MIPAKFPLDSLPHGSDYIAALRLPSCHPCSGEGHCSPKGPVYNHHVLRFLYSLSLFEFLVSICLELLYTLESFGLEVKVLFGAELVGLSAVFA